MADSRSGPPPAVRDRRIPVRSSPPLTAGFWLLLALMGGYALLNRTFAYVGVPPVYITEVIAALLLVLVPLGFIGRPWLLLPTSTAGRVALGATCAYVILGGIRLVPDLVGSAPIFDVLRNFAVVYYAGFAVLGYLALADDPVRRTRLTYIVVVALSTASNLTLAYVYFTSGLLEGPVNPYTKPISGHAVGFAILSACWLMAELQFRRPMTRVAMLGISMLLGLQLVFVYLSGHRSALLALAAAFATFIIAPNGRRVVLFGAASLGVFAIAVALVSPLRATVIGIAVKYLTLFSGTLDEPNALWRFLFWQRVLHHWAEMPFTGAGFSIDLSSLVPPEFPDLMARTDPHNSYLTVLVRTGVVALIALVTALGAAAGAVLRIVRHRQEPLLRATAATLAAGIAAYAVFAGMNVVLEGPYHGVPLWLLVGAAAALTCARRSRPGGFSSLFPLPASPGGAPQDFEQSIPE